MRITAAMLLRTVRMKQLRIKDNSIRFKEEFHIVSNLVNGISDKTLQQLEREGVFVFPELVEESEDITKDQMILQSVNGCYRSGNVMGFIGMGDERLVIESRFSLGDDYFFQYLLQRVLEVPNVVNLETEANQDNRLYNLLLFLFPGFLKAALRKGPYKTYIRRSYNDDNVRGTIDIARYIRQNTPFTGNIAYNQREYDYDNYLMELIRHTIEYIKGKPYGFKLLNSIKDEVKTISGVTERYRSSERKKIIEENQKNTIRHAFYHEYRALQQLCILILSNEKHQIGLGNRQVYGILFDGAWLWEEYVNLLIGERFYHPMNKAGHGSQWLFTCNNSKCGLIYPDFIGRDAENRIIADAKYKPEENIGNKDYLQVLAYMFRFDSMKAYYLYPEANEAADQTYWLNSGSSYENNVQPREDVRLIKHGLRIPLDAENYDGFVKQIQEQEAEFVLGL